MDCDGFFDFVKGYTKQPIGTEIEIADVASHPPITLMRIMSYAACFIAVISLSIFAYLWNTVNYSVYMDINPSVEMQFNAIGKLKTTTAINEDGTQLLDGLKLRGSAADTVPAVIMAADEKGFLNVVDGETAVLITVVARRGGSTDALIASIMAALDKHNMLGFTSIEGCSEEYRDRAASLGVSPGKLKLAEALILASDKPLSLKDALAMPIKSLFTSVRETGAGIIPDALIPLDPYANNNDPDAADDNPADPNASPDVNPVDINPVDPNTDPDDNPGDAGLTDPSGGSGGIGGIPGSANPSAVPDSNPGSPGQSTPVAGPGSNPGISDPATPTTSPGISTVTPGQTDPNADPGDSYWNPDPIKPDYSTGNNGNGNNTSEPSDPANEDPIDPGNGSGKSSNGNGSKKESSGPVISEPEPTSGYVDPTCDSDGYWWERDVDTDEISYRYNPNTALKHEFNKDNAVWEDGTGWIGKCTRCGKTLMISTDPNYFNS